MTTKAQYVTQCKAANPKPIFATINGDRRMLTDEEYDEAVERWAEMRVAQDQHAASMKSTQTHAEATVG